MHKKLEKFDDPNKKNHLGKKKKKKKKKKVSDFRKGNISKLSSFFLLYGVFKTKMFQNSKSYHKDFTNHNWREQIYMQQG